MTTGVPAWHGVVCLLLGLAISTLVTAFLALERKNLPTHRILRRAFLGKAHLLLLIYVSLMVLALCVYYFLHKVSWFSSLLSSGSPKWVYGLLSVGLGLILGYSPKTDEILKELPPYWRIALNTLLMTFFGLAKTHEHVLSDAAESALDREQAHILSQEGYWRPKGRRLTAIQLANRIRISWEYHKVRIAEKMASSYFISDSTLEVDWVVRPLYQHLGPRVLRRELRRSTRDSPFRKWKGRENRFKDLGVESRQKKLPYDKGRRRKSDDKQRLKDIDDRKLK